VALANASTTVGVDDIGMHLLHPQGPRTEVTVDPSIFDGYVGRYQLARQTSSSPSPGKAASCFAQATGQPKFELFAGTSEREYFLKAIDAQITFEGAGDGRAPALVLHQMARTCGRRASR